jgi:ketosteroid isomerase-like protein
MQREEVRVSEQNIDLVRRLYDGFGTGKATGKELNLLGAGVWDVRAGKIVRYRQLADTAEIIAVARA